MKKLLTPLFFIQALGSLFAQTAYIKGRISDSKSKETIIGATVSLDDTTGTVTDLDGNYFLKSSPGKHLVQFKFLSYTSQSFSVDLSQNDTLKYDVSLVSDSKQLDLVVVSAGRFEQKIGDVTVSMEVIRPDLINNKNTSNIETIIDQIPGVNVIDEQANIRGGSGFSYGAGSRVLMMVDEMPLLTADAGDVKWSFLPMENCEQIEVIKGASSALFGSSALNGVINFRTAYAKDVPETKIIFNGGFYDEPKRKELVWWDTSKIAKFPNPKFGGVTFTHSEKVKNLDIVIGGHYYNDGGYRQLENERRNRINMNLRYHCQKIKGLTLGLNFNSMITEGGLFLIWQGADSGAYRPAGGDLSKYVTYRTNIDPNATYYTQKGGRHSLRGRFFQTENKNTSNQESTADVWYAEYQYQKKFRTNLVTTAGVSYNYNEVHSGDLYGTHYSNNASAYLQLDKKFFSKLSVSFGIRGEYFKTDTLETRENINLFLDNSKPIFKNSKVKPVSRLGLNYQAMKATYFRASFGQGFRFPSVAERFIRTNASGLEIYPNDSLRPESGWSAEIAVKQGVHVGQWKGYLDVAFFRTEYRNMMEFTFGQYGTPVAPYTTPSQLGLGFKSKNIGNTRITGVDITLVGEGKIGAVNVSLLAGYTYINPIQTDFNPAIDTARNASQKNVLKYRYRHTAKGDVELGYKKVNFGVSCRYNSYMENIDRFFVDAIPGVKEYRAKNKKGDVVFDVRASYQLSKTFKMAIIVNNVLNREYVSRPADMQPPRTYALQATFKF